MGAQDDRSTWVEMPFWKQIKYYAISALIGAFVTYILTRLICLDYIIFNIHLQNLWLLAPESILLIGFLYIWNWSRSSERRKRQKEAAKQLQKLVEKAGGGKHE